MTQPTAALIIIGNEVLSGRTQDANLKFIATRLGELGIPLREARVIPDVPETIINTVNELRARFTYVFTTGGIGPTHDDITSECVARAFGVPWEVHEPSRAIMEADYARRTPPVEMNAARLRMATLPRGAEPILCSETSAPGFRMENVYVMAGVPRIMRSMFEVVAPTLQGGTPVKSRALHAHGLLEGQIAAGLSAIQDRYPTLDIGSYPYYRESGNGVALVAKGTDEAALEAAAQEIAALIRADGKEPSEGEPAT
jgi:molybdenum cofactor synthesis domain-containing protein